MIIENKMTGEIKLILNSKASQDVLIRQPQKKRFVGKMAEMVITRVVGTSRQCKCFLESSKVTP